MYRIYADEILIYDSTLEDYKIGKGLITREVDKSGSFVFSVYPDHPYYGQFIQLRTVITVYKSGRVVFRGRILDDTVDYWNVKTITCEGELGFLQDSVARPFSFQGSPADLFARFIAEHNEQADEWKQFKVGTVTVEDNNEYINRSAGGYGAMLDTMQSALTGSDLGGHFYITHGDDGADPIPTLHYVADFPKTASQGIEFGANLKDYTKKVDATELATCIIPLGTSNGTEGRRLTIKDVNGNKDYIQDDNAVAMYGRIVKIVTWDDVTLANHLLTKAKAYLAEVVNQHATIELNAVDMHLLDRSIESYNVCEYVRATSRPHGLDALMLCSQQTLDLLKPDNDTVTLGYTTGTLTGANVQLGASVSTLGKSVSRIQQDAQSIELSVQDLLQNKGQFLRIGADGVTITNAEGSEVTIDGGQIDAENLEVKAANITGKLKATQINAANLEVDAANIYGTLTAQELQGEEVALLDENENPQGYITITDADTADYALDIRSKGGLRLGADAGAVWVAVKDGAALGIFDENVSIHGDLIPGADADSGDAAFSVGSSQFRWADIWATDDTINTSDRNKKHDIRYDLARFGAFFDSLQPAVFKRNSGTSNRDHVGLIAQDVEAGLDACGLTGADFAGFVKFQNKDGSDGYGLRYGEFIGLLIDQVQKLKARVARLEAEKNG
jgi:hypothetical protein